MTWWPPGVSNTLSTEGSCTCSAEVSRLSVASETDILEPAGPRQPAPLGARSGKVYSSQMLQRSNIRVSRLQGCA